MNETPHGHNGENGEAVPARVVIMALLITLAAAGVELLGAWRGGSRFLAADAVHLLAHLGVFALLLSPAVRWHVHGEDFATVGILVLVVLVAIGILGSSLQALLSATASIPDPASMLLAIVGLAANMTVAYLFRNPAKKRWSFRAALAHELSDGALTVVGLAGALAIALFGWRWVDPVLSLGIGAWLCVWAGRLLERRIRLGKAAFRRAE